MTSGASPRELLTTLREGARASSAPDETAGSLNTLLEALERSGGDEDVVEEALEVLAGGRLDQAMERGLDLEVLARLGETLASRLEASSPGESRPESRSRAWAWLDVVRRPPVLRRIADASAVDRWMELILRLIDASSFTVPRLLQQRIEAYGPRSLFRVLTGAGETGHTWIEVGAQVDQLGRGFLALLEERGRAPVAFLSENRYEMAVADLACLGAGIVNVMIPSNATAPDVAFILAQSRAGTVVVSTEKQLRKVEAHRGELPDLQTVVLLDRPRPGPDAPLSLAAVAARGKEVPRERLDEAREAIDLRAPATIMYTSGTTGKPKGIVFSQRNIVSKRFARALALPEIGEKDVFLCYLPLCHTFGRYLEMVGCVFWGSSYVFLEDPSLETLRESMARVRPSVFISVPKKWIQLWEEIGRRADLEEDPEEVIREATRAVVGPRLRWGLSAAGYLAPEIFRFFQAQGVELMSGFGMTEATGGITMTPPGAYREDTLGVPLPGIEVRLDHDGEMMVRGPYVMLGYYEHPDGTGIDEQGWMRTGDVMEQDEARYFRLVDRKKEIYKNVKGESVAPQRVENLFRDFEAVKRVFLVGDHRPYNTALIVPNPEVKEVDLGAMSTREQRDYFRSLISSVNRFLAPYERIVDFALLDEDFTEERGELTPKGTYRRSTVARNRAELIDGLYRRTRLRMPETGVDVRLPNWFFQLLGLTAGDLRVEGNTLTLAPTGATLMIAPLGGEGGDGGGAELRVGSCRYRLPRPLVDLGVFLTAPALWLGNEELVRFAELEDAVRVRRLRPPREARLLGRAVEYRPGREDLEALERAAGQDRPGLEGLDLATRLFGSDDEEHGLLALKVVGRELRDEEENLSETALLALRSAAESPSLRVRRRAFRMLIPAEGDDLADAALDRFLAGRSAVLDEETAAELCEETLSDAKLQAFVRFAGRAAERAGDEAGEDGIHRTAYGSVVGFLAEYGAAHPVRFPALRASLAGLQAFAAAEEEREEARRALGRMTEGFRSWLGSVQRVAVDPEEGREYRWEDVITFEEDTDPEDRRRIQEAVAKSSLLREAVFLFSGGTMVRLSDLPPGGLWVSRLGQKHGKTVYRASLHTRFQGSFDLAINVNHGLSAEEVAEEIKWLIVAGGEGADPLVEVFGGYWEGHDLWSEEFIAGETLDRVVQRLSRSRDEVQHERLEALWPFFVWSTASAFVEFWNRTGRRWVIAEPSPADVIVPTHDYQTGTRIVSISGRRPSPGVAGLLEELWQHLVLPIEERVPGLAGVASPELILSAFVQALGLKEGLDLLRAVSGEEGAVTRRVEAWVARVEAGGFVPRRLHSAIERYHRWLALAEDPGPTVRAETVQELFETYNLATLLKDYPDARVRFFRETVFRDAVGPVVAGLDEVLAELRRRPLEGEELVERLTALRSHMEPGSDQEYFLARLTYPHLRPGDEAGFVSTEMGGVRQTDIVVHLQDHEGRTYRVRQAVNPKEVGRLHRLFLAAKLDVQFRPDHQYLVALSERGLLIGGLFYEVNEENHTAHLEKIVVSERYRKAGVSDGLMNEFFNRLRAAGLQTVTTGFFRPSYFYRFGFTIGKRHAGLVKTL